MKEVKSLTELKKAITGQEKSFLLLYKRGSDISECAFTNIQSASRDVKGLNLLYTDVLAVRDIHPYYQITSVPTLIELSDKSVKNLWKGCQDAQIYKDVFNKTIYFQEAKQKGESQKQVTVYSTPTCTWCNTLKTYLRKNRIMFTDIDISRDQHTADELVRRSGQTGVPQTEIDGEIVVGFNKARINELLSIKG